VKYQRLDIAVIRNGTKRPSVHLAELALKSLGYYKGAIDGWAGGMVEAAIKQAQTELIGTGIDGEMGEQTWTAVLPQAYKVGFNPPLVKRIQSMVSFFEVGTRVNAYGTAGAIEDGAGCNYGVAQHNAIGSVELVLKMSGEWDLLGKYRAHNNAWEGNQFHRAGRNPYVLPDLQGWFNSSAGIKAQDRYFEETTWKEAHKYLDQLPMLKEYEGHELLHPYWERSVSLMCDTMIQNGGLWSRYSKPFWRNLTDDEAKVPRFVELYKGARWDARLAEHFPYARLKEDWTGAENTHLATGMDKKKACYEANKMIMLRVLNLLKKPELQLFVIAQMRARTSSSTWWEDVESRRLLSALGSGTVHGTPMDLQADWGIGIERPRFEDPPENFDETFVKRADELFPELKEKEGPLRIS
jgi:hypothetical protein